jgi:predicted DNA-binding protein
LKSAELTKPSPTTSCATFRLPKEKLEQLRRISQAKSITPNTLVNQIIKAHLDWHSRAAHAKLYYLPKSFLVRLLN